MTNSFGARGVLRAAGHDYEIFSLAALADHDIGRLPFSLKILLENLLRFEDGENITHEDILAVAVTAGTVGSETLALAVSTSTGGARLIGVWLEGCLVVLVWWSSRGACSSCVR